MEFGTKQLILKRDKQTGQHSSCTAAYLSLSVDCVTLIGLPWRVSEDFTQITCSWHRLTHLLALPLYFVSVHVHKRRRRALRGRMRSFGPQCSHESLLKVHKSVLYWSPEQPIRRKLRRFATNELSPPLNVCDQAAAATQTSGNSKFRRFPNFLSQMTSCAELMISLFIPGNASMMTAQPIPGVLGRIT